jgi:hypothetical protein
MSDLLEDLENIFIYLDNILIITEIKEKYLKILEKVLRRLAVEEATINRKKCELFVHEMEYLGFIISKDDCRSNPKKIRVIMDLTVLSTLKKLCRFIEITNFLQCHILWLLTYLAPLNELIKGKLKKLAWTLEYTRMFKKAKQQIS